MARRVIPREALGAKGPLLALSLVCVVVSLLLYATDHLVGATTVLVAAFLLVATAKRA